MSRPRRGLTDEEVSAVCRWIVGTYIEAERGHIPATRLRGYLAAHLQFDLEQAVRAPGAPRLAGRDVGGARFNRIGWDRGYAVVVARETDGRWAAMVLVLRRDQRGAWLVTEITRLPARAVVSHPRRGHRRTHTIQPTTPGAAP